MRATSYVLVLLATLALQPIRAGEEPKKLGPFGADCRLAFTPDGKSLAVTTRGGSAVLVDLESGKRTARYGGDEDASESALAFSPDGSKLALGTLEGVVRVYETKGGKELLTVNHAGIVRALAFSSDGKVLVTSGGLPNKETPLEGEGEEATGGEEGLDPEGPTARTWDASTGEQQTALDPKSGNTSSAAGASPTAPIVIVARADGKIDLFNLGEKKKQSLEAGCTGAAVAFTADGKLAAVLGGTGGAGATLIDVGAGAVLKTLGSGAAKDGALALSPDGKVLALATPGVEGVQLFAVESGAQKTVGGGQVSSLAFSPDGKWLAVGLKTGEVQLLAPSK